MVKGTGSGAGGGALTQFFNEQNTRQSTGQSANQAYRGAAVTLANNVSNFLRSNRDISPAVRQRLTNFRTFLRRAARGNKQIDTLTARVSREAAFLRARRITVPSTSSLGGTTPRGPAR